MVTRVVPSVVGMTAAAVSHRRTGRTTANPPDHVAPDHVTATQIAPASIEIIGLPVRVIRHVPAETTTVLLLTGTTNHALNGMTGRADRQIDPALAEVTGPRVQVHDETRTPAQTAPGATTETGMSGRVVRRLGRATVLIPIVIALTGLVAHRARHLIATAMLMPPPGSTGTINPGSNVEIAEQDVAKTDHDSNVTMSAHASIETINRLVRDHTMATHVPDSSAGTIQTGTGNPAAMHLGHGRLIGMRQAIDVLVDRDPVLRATATTVTDQVGPADQINQPVGNPIRIATNG
jgi:hypothetical protein